jgi:hypothetical protein
MYLLGNLKIIKTLFVITVAGRVELLQLFWRTSQSLKDQLPDMEELLRKSVADYYKNSRGRREGREVGEKKRRRC